MPELFRHPPRALRLPRCVPRDEPGVAICLNGKILARLRSEHQVNMIGHETGSKDVDRDVVLRFGDQCNK